ncbi:hypothetical protein EYS09_30970 [Streptomyces kasugaensis]|uniref:Translation elongation factor EFTu-like domain-containing protein n=1 Tax=Streptomyces kasugaensis TaxID=1946 RepID=A0A4Q9HM63_STRKA|nr:hypothetical protein [Streptomyces kasugaensis]TBO55867.1 hypothetical protein EYS09_30970 [Streptomyces kasugaensis]
MGIFSRRPAARDAAGTDGPAGPFRFTVERVFAVPARGVVFTGTVTSGTVRVGQSAQLRLADGPRTVTVEAIDVRRRKRTGAAAGEEAGLYLAGFPAAEIPRVLGHGGAVQDDSALRGTEIVAEP